MSRTLNEQEIEQLTQFCRQHYVRYYDVQIELVDHLANAIETELESRPQLSFTDALQEVYKGFGPTGFRKMIASKEQALAQEHKHYHRQAFLSYFSLPKIVLTICALALVFMADQLTHYHIELRASILFGSSLAALAFEIILPIYLHYTYPKPKKELITRQVHSPFFSLLFFFYPCFMNLDYFFDHQHYLHTVQEHFISISLLNLLGLLLLLVLKEVIEKIYRKAYRDYPMAFK